MGGAVSTNSKKVPASTQKISGNCGVVSLPDVAEHLRLYQNAISSEVLVLMDQDIGSYVSNPSQWHQLDVSTQQKDYFKTVKITVTVPNENIQITQGESKIQENNSNHKNDSKETDNNNKQNSKEGVTMAQMDPSKMVFRHIVDTTSDSNDSKNGGGTHIKATLPNLKENERGREHGKFRKFQPIPYLPLSICKLPDNDLQKGNSSPPHFADDSKRPSSFRGGDIGQYKTNGNDMKTSYPQEKSSKDEQQQQQQQHIVPPPSSSSSSSQFSNQRIPCSTCGKSFYGVTAIEAVEDHQYFCEETLMFRRKLDKDMIQMQQNLHELSEWKRMEEYTAITYAINALSENQLQSSTNIRIDVIHRRIGDYIRRIKNIKYNNVDLIRLQRLYTILQYELSLLQYYLPNHSHNNHNNSANSSNKSYSTGDKEIDDYYVVMLTKYYDMIYSLANFLSCKIQLVKEYEWLLPKITNYQLLKVIGKGGFGTVFLAKRKQSQQHNNNGNDSNNPNNPINEHSSIRSFVALKALNKEDLRKSKLHTQILRERYVMSSSNSYPDYFVRLYDSFQTDDYLFLSLEYVPGGDCMTLLNTLKFFPEIVAQHFIAQVCLAVKHLHEHGVVHRDIKPDNVMVTSRGHAKLGDFGLTASYCRDTLSSMINSQPLSSAAHRSSMVMTLSPASMLSPNMNTAGKKSWLDFSFEDMSASDDVSTSNNQTSMGSSSSLIRVMQQRTTTTNNAPNYQNNNHHNQRSMVDSSNESSMIPSSSGRQYSTATLPDASSTPYSQSHTQLPRVNNNNNNNNNSIRLQTTNQKLLAPTVTSPPAIRLKSHKKSRKAPGKLNSRVGNFYYACPEIVIDDAYDHTVDWWAVAVLCFHFVSGVTPFEASSQKETLENIYTYNANWNVIPNYITNDCKLFIASIITKPLEKRLGYERSEHILQHPFFHDIDFNTIYTGYGPIYPQISTNNNTTTGKKTMLATTSNDTLTNASELPLFTLLNEQDANEIPDFTQSPVLNTPLSAQQQSSPHGQVHSPSQLQSQSSRRYSFNESANNNINAYESHQLLSMIHDFEHDNDFEGFNFYA